MAHIISSLQAGDVGGLERRAGAAAGDAPRMRPALQGTLQDLSLMY